MILKLDGICERGKLSFGGLQIYMVLKRRQCISRQFHSFGVLQIYMVLKHEDFTKLSSYTFEVLQIYMILKLLNIVANLLDTTNLHASYTKFPMGTAQWSEYQSRSFPS